MIVRDVTHNRTVTVIPVVLMMLAVMLATANAGPWSGCSVRRAAS